MTVNHKSTLCTVMSHTGAKVIVISGPMATVLEKIATDSYKLLAFVEGVSKFEVPKQRLAVLPVLNEYTRDNFMVC